VGLIDETVSDQREESRSWVSFHSWVFFSAARPLRALESEVIVMIRPYVLSTPSEAEEAGKRLIAASSIHPKATGAFPADEPAHWNHEQFYAR